MHEALKHAGVHHGCSVRVRWFDAEGMSLEEAQAELESADGVLVPGGFGSRGWEGKILACRVAREREIPYLGICLGMHVAVSEFARHVVGLEGANSTEMDPETPFPVIDLLPEQKEIEDLGGTMRLGAQAVELAEGTQALAAYNELVVHERHRHRYEVNNQYRQQLVDAGLVVSGTFQAGRLVEIVELRDHPWFVASQFHPEFKSRPTRPAPLFRDFVGAAFARSRERAGADSGRGDLAVGPEHGHVVREAGDLRLGRAVAKAAHGAVLAADGGAPDQLARRDHRLELALGLGVLRDVRDAQLQQLLAGVAEQLARGRVGGHVAHLVVGDEDRHRRVLHGLAEEDALDEWLGRAHAVNLARTTTIA